MLWVNGKLAIAEIVFIQCTIRNLTYKDAGRVLRLSTSNHRLSSVLSANVVVMLGHRRKQWSIIQQYWLHIFCLLEWVLLYGTVVVKTNVIVTFLSVWITLSTLVSL